jgi:Predicted integral membrane protein
MAHVQIKKQQVWWALGTILLFAAITRLLIAMTYLNSFDTEWYLKWAVDIQNGLLNAYDGHVRDLDYPPVYLILLWPVGKLLNVNLLANYQPYRMLLIKFWPILFDLLTIAAIYLIFRKRSVFLALCAAAAWAVNPSAIFNCACWGQTDTIMTFQLLLVFAAFDEEKPLWATFCFALAALTKMQCLYFAPVILFWFIRRKDWRNLGRALGIGFGTVLAGFLPFMIASRNARAIFEIYFGGFGKYPYINLNAFNLYGLGSFNWVTDRLSIVGGTLNDKGQLVGGFTFSMLGTILMIASVVFVCWVMLAAKKTNIWLHAALLMQCLFILTTRQHERYQFIVMILLLGAFLTEQDFKLFGLFTGVSFVTFFNQSLLLDKIIHQDAPYIASFNTLQAIGSAINVVLFFCTAALCILHTEGFQPVFGGKQSQRKVEANS